MELGSSPSLCPPPPMSPPARAYTAVHSRARTWALANSPSQSSRAGGGWPGCSNGPSRPHVVSVGSSIRAVPVEEMRSGREEGTLMGIPVSSFSAKCCHEHPHFTGEKTEALRSQNPALANPKDCSTPSSRKPSLTPSPKSTGLGSLSTLLPRPSSPPGCVLLRVELHPPALTWCVCLLEVAPSLDLPCCQQEVSGIEPGFSGLRLDWAMTSDKSLAS